MPLVLDAARKGDEVASEVLRSEGEQLGYLTRLLLRRLSQSAPEPLPIAFAGSIMQHVPPVRSALIADVQGEFPAVQTLDGVVDPILGALWRARSA